MQNWNTRGIFPNDAEKRGVFYGRRGMLSYTGNPLPSVALTPSSSTIFTNGNIELTATATNTIGYEWQTSVDMQNWTALAGNQKTTYSKFIPHKKGQAGTYYYRVICRGLVGDTISPVATVVVKYLPPTVTISTDKETLMPPGAVNMTASSTFAESHQWYHSTDGAAWELMAGKTESTCTVNYSGTDSGLHHYRCDAVGLGGTASSNTITIDVLYLPPTVTISTDKETLMPPGVATLTAETTFADDLFWYHSTNGTSWELITETSSQTIALNYSDMDSGLHHYRCDAVGRGGTSRSNTITIDVLYLPPTITISTDKETVIVPDTVTITADPRYTDSLQWYHSTDGAAWELVADATDDTLVVNCTEADAGVHYYRCDAEGLGGTAQSDAVVIVVTIVETTEPEPTEN